MYGGVFSISLPLEQQYIYCCFQLDRYLKRSVCPERDHFPSLHFGTIRKGSFPGQSGAGLRERRQALRQLKRN